MFTSIFLFLPFLAVALLPVVMKSCFSSDGLDDMGISLEDPAGPSGFVDQADYLICSSTMLCGQA